MANGLPSRPRTKALRWSACLWMDRRCRPCGPRPGTKVPKLVAAEWGDRLCVRSARCRRYMAARCDPAESPSREARRLRGYGHVRPLQPRLLARRAADSVYTRRAQRNSLRYLDFPSDGWSAGCADARYAMAQALLSHLAPDGKWIAYASFVAGKAVLRKAEVGSRSQPVALYEVPAASYGSIGGTAWSPRGDWIVCETMNGLTLVKADGSGNRALVPRFRWCLGGLTMAR